jgi:hypothetical protein
MIRFARRWRSTAGAAAAALLAACAGGPAAPDWQLNSKAAIDRAVAAYLAGDSALEAREFEMGRAEIARTGRVDLMSRAELIRCAARVASLVFDACEGFEKLRPQAQARERAYADFLQARVQAQDIGLLPPQQRVAAANNSSAEASLDALHAIKDPFSRLVAAAGLFQAGRARRNVMALAVDTASDQGWRRPLLAWLNAQALRAEKIGATAEAERLRRRIGLVQGSN